MIFVVQSFHWRPIEVVMGWVCRFDHNNFDGKISPFPPRFARPSSPTNAGIVFEGEGVNPSLAYNERLSLTLMWTWKVEEKYNYMICCLSQVLCYELWYLVNFLSWIWQCVHFYVDWLEAAQVFQTLVNLFGIFDNLFKCIHFEEGLNFPHY